MFLQWAGQPPKLSLPLRRSWPHLILVPWVHINHPTKQHRDRFIRCCRAQERDRQADNHATPSVAACHILYIECHAVRPNKNEWWWGVCNTAEKNFSIFSLIQKHCQQRHKSSKTLLLQQVAVKHCGVDRHTVAKKGTCSTTAGTVTLASYSSTDRVQAGRTDIQDPLFNNPSVPRPSHQIESNFTSSSFLRRAFTAQTYYQNSINQSINQNEFI